MTKWLNTSFWNFVARTLLRNRHWVLLCIALFTIFMASQWKYIRFTQTEANLLPADHKENIAYNDFLKKFGEEGNVIIFAVNSAVVFKPETYKAWNNMMAAIAKNKEVEANAAKTPEQTAQQNKAYVATGSADGDKSNPPQPNSNDSPASTAANGTGSPPLDTGKRLPGDETGPRIRKNPLGDFSSYTYQITFYMITPDAYNAFVLSGKKDINAFQNALTAANVSTIDNSNSAGGAGGAGASAAARWRANFRTAHKARYEVRSRHSDGAAGIARGRRGARQTGCT